MKKNEFYTEKISDIIKSLRKEENFSQKEFAERILNISRRQLIRIENKESTPSISILISLMKNFDSMEIISQLQEENGYEYQINQIYEELKTSSFDFEDIRDQIYNIFDSDYYGNLTNSQKENLDIILCFIDFKETQDSNFFDKILKQNRGLYFEKNIKLANILLLDSDNKEIINFLFRLKNYNNIFSKNKRDMISLYLNAIGILLNRRYNDVKFYDSLFVELEEKIFSNLDYLYFLPVYYRHISKYYLMYKNEEKYKINIEKALYLSRLFKMNYVYNDLKKECENFDE